MSPAPDRVVQESGEGRFRSGPPDAPSRRSTGAQWLRGESEPRPSGRTPPAEPPPPPPFPRDLRCRRCRKSIRDLEMEPAFSQTGLCFWCAYVDSQG